jgi:TRAP-type mannitol/chloroaromatic compound transport system permease large subunit
VLDWLADHLALIMFVTMFAAIFCGYPVAFVMGGMALLFALAGSMLGVFSMIGLSDVVLRMWGGVAADPVLASIPMFIFMGAILERSGSAMDMLKATEVLLRRVPGALAVAVMVMGTILAAPIGVVGAAVVTLSVIALPQMLASGYDKRLAIGTIASAGTLGILIPPAIMLVVMAEMLSTSAGALFLAATVPGFLLSLSMGTLSAAIWSACRANALVFLIFLGATGFSYVFRVLGGDDLMISTLEGFGVDTAWEMLTFVMILIFLLGFPFEWIEICLIVLPVFGPILMQHDFSDHLGEQRYLTAWFGALVAVNLQTSFMTPPFGATLFYMKGTAPPGVTMGDVYRGMYPFVALQVVGLGICIYYPSVVLWLPGLAGFLD